ICSANGHCFSICAHPNILKLLKRLNSGETLHIQRVVAEYAGIAWADGTKFEALLEDIRAFMEKLYSFRAITIDRQPAPRRRKATSPNTEKIRGEKPPEYNNSFLKGWKNGKAVYSPHDFRARGKKNYMAQRSKSKANTSKAAQRKSGKTKRAI